MSNIHDLSKIEVHTIETVEDALEFQRWLGNRRDFLAIDIETSGLTFWSDVIRTVQFGDWDTAWVIRWDDWRQVAAEALLKYEGDIVGHNVVFDLKFITHHLGVPSTRWNWSKIHDTQTMAFLLDPLQSKGLKPLSGRYISARAVGGQEQLEADMRKGKWTWATVPLTLPSYVFYGGLDTILTARLARLFSEQIRERNMVEAYELEQATEGVLFRMILKGLVIDFEYCERTRSRLLSEADEDLAQIRALGVTNPNSRPQLLKQLLADGVVLTERTESGQLKLDKEVLPFIDHPLAKLVTSYRNKTKWAETYFTNFIQTTNPATGCLHPEVRQFAARTGRMSVTNPAMQTLPRGPLVRDAVIAPEGEKIVAADFSSVEARLFAHFAREQGMIEAIKGGLDFHTYTAQQAYGLGDSLPTKEQRQIAKNTTFCLIYGGGPAKIAKTAGITEAEARGFVDRYERAFPGFRRFQKEIIDTARRRARDTGRPYIETHLGTRLYVPDSDEAYKLTNYIIQGSARIVLADRMVALDNADVMQYAQLVVHDEVDFRIPDDIVDDVRHVIGEVMADRHTFLVDLDADVSPPAQRWGEAK